MNTRHTHRQVSAFVMAALVTGSLAFGIQGLATAPAQAQAEQLAAAATPVQVVVITGQRLPRS